MKLSRLIAELERTLARDGDREVHLSTDYPATHPVSRVWVGVDAPLVVIAAEGSVVRHPEITVSLVGLYDNPFAILGAVRAALPAAEREEFVAEATSGGDDHVLAVVREWVKVS